METVKSKPQNINRKKFFSSLGTGIFGYFVIKSIPFSSFRKKEKAREVVIVLNPDAVSRTKIGEKNV